MKRAASSSPGLRRDRQKAVLVGMDQLPRLDPPPEHFHLAAPADRPDVGVAHAQPPGQGLEARAGHLVQVADGPVDDRSHAAQRAVDAGVDFAPE
jgi:hypothetical protein